MAEIPDVITGEVISSNWGNDIRDRTVQRYATVAARSAAIPTPVEGDLSYLEDTGVVEVYDGTSWLPMVVPLSIEMGGATELVTDAGTTGTFENGASVTFVPPSHWNNYKVMAWGNVQFQIQTAGHAGGCRVSIDGNAGTEFEMNVGFDESLSTIPAQHNASGISGTAVVVIQYHAASGAPAKTASLISFLAVRET